MIDRRNKAKGSVHEKWFSNICRGSLGASPGKKPDLARAEFRCYLGYKGKGRFAVQAPLPAPWQGPFHTQRPKGPKSLNLGHPYALHYDATASPTAPPLNASRRQRKSKLFPNTGMPLRRLRRHPYTLRDDRGSLGCLTRPAGPTTDDQYGRSHSEC